MYGLLLISRRANPVARIFVELLVYLVDGREVPNVAHLTIMQGYGRLFENISCFFSGLLLEHDYLVTVVAGCVSSV